MGSKGRIPPPHVRRPLPGPGMVHPDPFGPTIRPPPSGFPPFDILPLSEVMGQKLAAQHIDMQKLATENQRLAATHGTLRQELAASQHELQMLHAHIGDMKSESDHQKRILMDKIAGMEAELHAAHSMKTELQQLRPEAQSLVAGRPELIYKVQQLDQDLQRAHFDIQQIPVLLSELDGLRQEYQHCRATYDYEKKLRNDHLESLQVMEKNYLTMARELEKLRSKLANSSNFDRGTGAYGGNARYTANDASANYLVGQNAYGNSYGVSQGKVPLSIDGSSGLASGASAGAASAVAGGVAPVVAQSGSGNAPVTQGAAYDATRGPSFDTQQRGPTGAAGYEVHRGTGGPGYDAQRGTPIPGYQAQRGPGYDAHLWTAYEGHGATFNGYAAHLYDSHRESGYDHPKMDGFDKSSGVTGTLGQITPMKNVPYQSATPPAHSAGMGEGTNPGGRNAVQR